MLEKTYRDNPLLDFPYFASNFLKIRSKSGAIVPLILNRAQMYAHNLLENQLQTTGKVRAIICKGRQQGMSTYTGARFCHRTITSRGMKAFILTHESEATTNLFEITKRYVDNMPKGLCPKPDTSAANKLYFKTLDSGYAVGTAGNKVVGRSQTLQLLHASEVAFWPSPEEHAKGVLQAVSRENGTEIIMESTANGIGNYFHRQWLSAINGDSEYIPIFVPWYWQNEYSAPIKNEDWMDEELQLLDAYASNGLTKQHLAWRRLKIAEFSNDIDMGINSFKQEFPFTWEEAFRSPVADAFISSLLVSKARGNKVKEDADMPLIIGVDVAIGDNDNTAISRRRGRKVSKTEVWRNHNTMETANRIRNIIDTENPHKVYIDVIGVGAGVVDRLIEQGYGSVVEGINVANRASERFKFHNKRAELWASIKSFLDGESPVELPDDDALHGELCNIGFKVDGTGRIQLESKDDIRKRGLPSPDRADALALTFSGGKMFNIFSMMPSPGDLNQMRNNSGLFY